MGHEILKALRKYLPRTFAAACGIALLCAAAGYGFGRVAGGRLIAWMVLGGKRFPLIIAQPLGRYYDIFSLINSTDPFSRLSGYYALREAGMMDDRFFMERYTLERITPIKRTLLWLVSFSRNPSRAVEWYASVYPSSEKSLQEDIVRWMYRLDPEFCTRFARDNKIDLSRIPGR